MLLIPYEEHSQQEKGGKEHGYMPGAWLASAPLSPSLWT